MISIIIPLYNKEKSIRKTLESIFNQTFQDYEIVIINDGSTDHSVEIVTQIKDNRIRLIHQENQGVSVARNRGIEEAKYNYVAFLDADDTWLPGYLKAQFDLIHYFPDCKVYGCAYDLCDSKGNVSGIILNKMSFTGMTGILSNYFEVASCSHPPLWTSAVVVEREAIKSVDGFPVGIRSGEDLLTWAYLSVKYKIAYNKEPLAIFNFPESVKFREVRLEKNDVVFNKLLDLYNTSDPSVKKGLKAYIGRWNEMRVSIFIDSNRKMSAFRPLFRMIKYKGIDLKAIYLTVLILIPSRFRELLMVKLKKKYHDNKK